MILDLAVIAGLMPTADSQGLIPLASPSGLVVPAHAPMWFVYGLTTQSFGVSGRSCANVAVFYLVTLARQVQRVSACGLARDGDAVLLVQIGRSAYGDAGKWMLPGGGIEHGEDPKEAVIRSFAEQIGLTVQVDELLEVGSDYRHLAGGIDFHGIFIVYGVTITAGDLRAEPDGAVLSPTWVKPTEMDALPVLDTLRPVLARR